MRSEVRALPEEFLDRLGRMVPRSKWDEIANTFAQRRPTTFRVNTLKASPCAIQEVLQADGFGLKQISWYKEAFLLERRSLRELQKTPAYREGKLYVQSLSSMVPALVLDPQPGEEVLDIAAAPGGKTTQMICLMKGQGVVVANDNNRVRFFKLKANVELQDSPHVELTLKAGEAFGRTHPNRFDRVLVDAPCSAEGRFQIHEPRSFGFWKLAKIREMVRKQRRLLASAINATRPGGKILYSTCTFAPEENEGIIDWALDRFPGQLTLEPIALSFPKGTSGLSSWEGKAFSSAVRRAVRILPTSWMEGFFLARLRKVAANTPTDATSIARVSPHQ